MIYEQRRAALRAAIKAYRWAAEGHSATCARGAPESERVQLYRESEAAAARVEAAIAALEQPPDPPRGGAGWDAVQRHAPDILTTGGPVLAAYDAGRRDAAALVRAEWEDYKRTAHVAGSSRWSRLADAIDGGTP